MPARCGSQDCCSQCPRTPQQAIMTTALLETPTHRQVWLSPLWVTVPFWVLVRTRFCCALRESVSLRFSVLLPDTQAGKFVVGPELLQQRDNFFGVIVLQSVGPSAQLLHSGAT